MYRHKEVTTVYVININMNKVDNYRCFLCYLRCLKRIVGYPFPIQVPFLPCIHCFFLLINATPRFIKALDQRLLIIYMDCRISRGRYVVKCVSLAYEFQHEIEQCVLAMPASSTRIMLFLKTLLTFCAINAFVSSVWAHSRLFGCGAWNVSHKCNYCNCYMNVFHIR